MKTTVVPAQITTVEDKIAGSLTFMQIFLLVSSLIFGTIIFGIVPPRVHMSAYKLIPIVLQFFIFGSLALRFRGKILLEWLVVYIKYKARPRVYIFTKNDLAGREVLEDKAFPTEQLSPAKAMKKTKRGKKRENLVPSGLPDNLGAIISVKPSRKGGLDVIYRQA